MHMLTWSCRKASCVHLVRREGVKNGLNRGCPFYLLRILWVVTRVSDILSSLNSLPKGLCDRQVLTIRAESQTTLNRQAAQSGPGKVTLRAETGS